MIVDTVLSPLFRTLKSSLRGVPPIVVGATGGSGTRALHGVLARAGVFMGIRLNGAGDAMDFEPLLDAVINDILARTKGLDYTVADLPSELREHVKRDFGKALRAYSGECPPGARWGWKNPRMMYLLPFIHERFPGMSFVHVVRDGRDMALSSNQNQLRKHYGALFGSRPEADDALASLALWATANGAVASWGERTLGDRYVRVRLEDLCAAPMETCAGLAERLDLPMRNAELLASGIVTPPTLGRWRSVPETSWAGISDEVNGTLARFGYEPASGGSAGPG